MPTGLTTAFFQALDENQDGHIDFKELCCGVSAACRGPELERQKFCFKVFDADNDGMLNVAEITTMVEYLLEIKSQTLDEQNGPETNCSKIVTEILNTKDLSMNLIDGKSIVSDNEYQNDSARVCNQSFLTIENYLVW